MQIITNLYYVQFQYETMACKLSQYNEPKLLSLTKQAQYPHTLPTNTEKKQQQKKEYKKEERDQDVEEKQVVGGEGGGGVGGEQVQHAVVALMTQNCCTKVEPCSVD